MRRYVLRSLDLQIIEKASLIRFQLSSSIKTQKPVQYPNRAHSRAHIISQAISLHKNSLLEAKEFKNFLRSPTRSRWLPDSGRSLLLFSTESFISICNGGYTNRSWLSVSCLFSRGRVSAFVSPLWFVFAPYANRNHAILSC